MDGQQEHSLQPRPNPFAEAKDVSELVGIMRRDTPERSISTDKWDISRMDLIDLGEKIVELRAGGAALDMVRAYVESDWAEKAVRERIGKVPRFGDGRIHLTDDFAPHTFLPHEIASEVVQLADQEARARSQIGFGDMYVNQRIRAAKAYIRSNSPQNK